MNAKTYRIKKIKNYLRLQTEPKSISEIHEALVGHWDLMVSRKTIERDILELEDSERLQSYPGTPTRYTLKGAFEVEITLQIQEIQYLLTLIDHQTDLAQKLRKSLSQEG